MPDEGAQPGHRVGPRLRHRHIGRLHQRIQMLSDDLIEQVLLGLDVVVERGRLDADIGGQRPQAHRLIAMPHDQLQRRAADEGGGPGAVGACNAGHRMLSDRGEI